MTNQTTTVAEANTHHATKAKAQRLADALAAEYPALSLVAVQDGENPVEGWVVFHTAEDGTETTVLTTTEPKAVPELVAVLEACEEEGVDPEEGYEEPSVGGSVVREEYRARYKTASASGQTCGDWLAEFLTSHCWSFSDGFHAEAFQQVLDRNGVDQTRPWAKLPQSGQKGWVGRWRMNGRQALEKHVAVAGEVVDPNGNTHKLPKKEAAALREKHAKYVAKQEKLAAEATQAQEA